MQGAVSNDNSLTNRVDVGKAFELRMKGMAYTDIAKVLGVSKQAVHSRLQRFTKTLENPECVKVYDENVDTLLSSAQLSVLDKALDRSKLKAAGTLQLVTSFGILFDKQRLVRGQSTQIISNCDLTADEREQLRVLDAKIIEDQTPQDVVDASEDTALACGVVAEDKQLQ